MQVIRIHHPLNKQLIADQPVVLAMGFFDGVHLGHQLVIKTAKKIADQRGLPLAVLTYNHSPAVVYHRLPGGAKYLTTINQKAELMSRLGVSVMYVVDFTSQYGAQSPQQFVDNYLMAFHPEVAVAGEDHTFGRGVAATMSNLPSLANERFQVVAVPTMENGLSKIGTSRIRRQIMAGELDLATQGLGRPYQTTGLVVHGFARGRQIGFPTINIDSPSSTVIPALGVYVTRVKVGHHWYGGMANIGHNETFGDGAPRTVEINLFDFHQLVYGEEVVVEWYSRLRDGVKFASVEELVTQMRVDQQAAKAYLASHPRKMANTTWC
ncbi:MAG: riboflavin biosynthesis protein RibF [[Lactobacillus] timonensis]|uniref:riboflavin biosynthesis protein RibF n=1 Tax=[Lactobacillus] timonensis TaxID=1970790 RepID=UPI000C851021|nr:riboflavin biosynthesis protein RibF [[Lactobacillus] timonensis]MCI1925979.1 riboflavin biosynthesis protein RibF [[Lactobacillus] timonensis]MCI1957303.1 riboflavin biosynthesis protein RibF [[Lactobacillus] timonensis]MCI1970352.1 riboflavin biosynthesis protein RibF [[Lactobacillus] timonensis]MCI2006497.1 riboflavin biosynthesis protein RibF [[Lactobacillus] timonensis]